jgi:hypothetical protein
MTTERGHFTTMIRPRRSRSMNDWPPPGVDDVPPEPAAPDRVPWWQRPLTHGLLVAWVVGGLVAFVLITLSGSQRDNPEAIESVPTPTTAPATTTRSGSAGDATPPPTTEPQVRSAPPVPIPPSLIEPPPSATPPVATETTIVVTLPPAPTIEITPPAPSAPRIGTETRFDADGDDVANLNDEWVRFTNEGTQPLDLTGWIVRDDGLTHAHVFETLTLAPGAAVTLYSGCGAPTDTSRFFCSTDSEIWNNDGDVVSLYDDGRFLVLQVRG